VQDSWSGMVKDGKTRSEHIFSELPRIADMVESGHRTG